jgi:AraC family transcriptional regulator
MPVLPGKTARTVRQPIRISARLPKSTDGKGKIQQLADLGMEDAITTASGFQARFDRVISHIDEHTGRLPPLEELAAIAAYSPFHLHRQFTALFGIPLGRYVRLVRMHRAAHTLLYRKDIPVTDIAFDAGYENAESFSRAFRKLHDQSPVAFRQTPPWDTWQQPYKALQEIRERTMSHTTLSDVSIIEMPATRTICLDHIGPPERIGETIQRFIAWRKQHHLHPSKYATFNILWCNPEDTPPENFRMGLAVSTSTQLTVEDTELGFTELTIPNGRFAKLRHVGSDQTLGQTALRLYRDWLPQSGENAADFPQILQRIAFYPDVADHEAITDVLLPLAS